LFGNLLLSHIVDQFIHVFIFNFLLITLHDVLNILIHHIHPLLLSHKPFHGLLIIFAFHLIVGPTHYLGHPRHNILHGLTHAHLLQPKSIDLYSKVTPCSWASKLLYLLIIWLFFRICWAITFWDCWINHINTAGCFFSIFFLRSFWRVFPWYSSFSFSRVYSRRIWPIYLVYSLTCSKYNRLYPWVFFLVALDLVSVVIDPFTH